MNRKETPILLLTGYLGSGKTTLVNHILSNEKGIKFAVIVNDIGEVNIDAELIQKGGVVGKKDESLVALQNGCICCTLRMDLIEQINDILKMRRFDYIVIEASGICEPAPIAQTICSIPSMGGEYTEYGLCRLDSIVTVVDALRLQSEFSCGDGLTRKGLDEEDIENLIIQQIEFCNIILLNKAAEVKPAELERIKQILQALQPGAEIIECNYAEVDLNKIIHTRKFDFERVATSAGWIREIERPVTEEEEAEAKRYGHRPKQERDGLDGHSHHVHGDEDFEEPEYAEQDHSEHDHAELDHAEHEYEEHGHLDHDHSEHDHEEHDHSEHDHSEQDHKKRDHSEYDHEEHDHAEHDREEHNHAEHAHGHGHHHHHHEGGEVEEYGIGTFVYYRRPAFNVDKFNRFVTTKWSKNIIRAKGVCYFSNNRDMSYLFEQAGVQKTLKEAGMWYATAPEEDLIQLMIQEPGLMRDWDEKYGDRMQKIVFIGQHLDKEELTRELDECLE